MERILSDLDLSKHQGKMQEKQITLDTFEYLVTQERETRNKLNSERINNHQNKMHQLFPTSRSIHQSAVDNLNQLKEMVQKDCGLNRTQMQSILRSAASHLPAQPKTHQQLPPTQRLYQDNQQQTFTSQNPTKTTYQNPQNSRQQLTKRQRALLGQPIQPTYKQRQNPKSACLTTKFEQSENNLISSSQNTTFNQCQSVISSEKQKLTDHVQTDDVQQQLVKSEIHQVLPQSEDVSMEHESRQMSSNSQPVDLPKQIHSNLEESDQQDQKLHESAQVAIQEDGQMVQSEQLSDNQEQEQIQQDLQETSCQQSQEQQMTDVQDSQCQEEQCVVNDDQQLQSSPMEVDQESSHHSSTSQSQLIPPIEQNVTENVQAEETVDDLQQQEQLQPEPCISEQQEITQTQNNQENLPQANQEVDNFDKQQSEHSDQDQVDDQIDVNMRCDDNYNQNTTVQQNDIEQEQPITQQLPESEQSSQQQNMQIRTEQVDDINESQNNETSQVQQSEEEITVRQESVHEDQQQQQLEQSSESQLQTSQQDQTETEEQLIDGLDQENQSTKLEDQQQDQQQINQLQDSDRQDVQQEDQPVEQLSEHENNQEVYSQQEVEQQSQNPNDKQDQSQPIEMQLNCEHEEVKDTDKTCQFELKLDLIQTKPDQPDSQPQKENVVVSSPQSSDFYEPSQFSNNTQDQNMQSKQLLTVGQEQVVANQGKTSAASLVNTTNDHTPAKKSQDTYVLFKPEPTYTSNPISFFESLYNKQYKTDQKADKSKQPVEKKFQVGPNSPFKPINKIKSDQQDQLNLESKVDKKLLFDHVTNSQQKVNQPIDQKQTESQLKVEEASVSDMQSESSPESIENTLLMKRLRSQIDESCPEKNEMSNVGPRELSAGQLQLIKKALEDIKSPIGRKRVKKYLMHKFKWQCL